MTDVKELVKALREEADWCKAIEWEIPICTEDHIREAADLIEKLVTDIDVVRKERDAAVADLKSVMPCKSCKHCGVQLEFCKDCYAVNNFEWRGIDGNT